MVKLDFSLVVQIVLFVVFWLLLRRILFAPIGRLMEERERRTTGAELQANAMRDEAKQLQAEYEAEIAKARAEGEAIKNEIRAEAARARDLIIAQGHEATTQTLQSMREEIRREMQAARRDIAQEAESLAQDMTAKVLGREIA